MSFYKLESTYNTFPLPANSGAGHSTLIIRPIKKKITYNWWCDTYDKMLMFLNRELKTGAKVAVRTISQAEYIRGLER